MSENERNRFVFESKHQSLRWKFTDNQTNEKVLDQEMEQYEMQYGLRLAKAAKKFEKFRKF